MQTLTQAIEVKAERGDVFRILADVSSIPIWAPDFATSAEQVADSTWNMDKEGTTFLLHVDADPVSLTVDYLRLTAPRPLGAFLRVLRGPERGSVVLMTVPLAGDRTAEQVTATVLRELHSLANQSIETQGGLRGRDREENAVDYLHADSWDRLNLVDGSD